MKSLIQKITREFELRYSDSPLIVRSPGRVNLLGEHTDYNDGFVLPAAINKSIILALAPNDLDRIRLYGVDMEKPDFETDISSCLEKSDRHWPNYILGVVDQLLQRGMGTGGFDCVIGGYIPVGAGLSSSAAVTGGVVYGLSRIFDLGLERKEMARIGQQAENNFVGVQCGIMDHFTNIFGNKGQVIKLDCRSYEYEYYPFTGKDTRIVLFDTGVRRELAATGYNVRRSQCEEGVQLLKQFEPDILNLRDVTFKLLEDHKKDLPEEIYHRCRYVLDENARVASACNDLVRGDFRSFGKWMYFSHYGLRDLYDVSCLELDVLVDATEDIEGVLGARMMGGGFGGCTINLVEKSEIDSHINRIAERYKEKTGELPEVYVVDTAEGTGSVSAGDKVIVEE